MSGAGWNRRFFFFYETLGFGGQIDTQVETSCIGNVLFCFTKGGKHIKAEMLSSLLKVRVNQLSNWEWRVGSRLPGLFCSAQFFFPFHEVKVQVSNLWVSCAICFFQKKYPTCKLLAAPKFCSLAIQSVSGIQKHKVGELLPMRVYAVRWGCDSCYTLCLCN